MEFGGNSPRTISLIEMNKLISSLGLTTANMAGPTTIPAITFPSMVG